MTLACASLCHVVSGTSRWSSLERTTECRFLQGETPQGASILVYHHICKTHSKMVTVYAFLLSLRWLALNFSSQFFRDRSPCPFIYFDSWNKPGDWKRYLDLSGEASPYWPLYGVTPPPRGGKASSAHLYRWPSRRVFGMSVKMHGSVMYCPHVSCSSTSPP